MVLSEAQRRAVRSGDVVRVEEDGVKCVVLREDVYDRVSSLLIDDQLMGDAELRRMLAKSADANGWNEPEMDAYDNYEQAIQQR